MASRLKSSLSALRSFIRAVIVTAGLYLLLWGKERDKETEEANDNGVP